MISNLNKGEQEVLLDSFKQYLYAEDSRRNTTNAYLSDLAHFFAWYSQVEETFDIESITPTDIRRYRESLQEQVPALSPATINRRLAALRRFFTWAREQQAISVSPTHRIRNVESIGHGPKSLDRKQWNRLQRTVEQAKGSQGIRDRCIVLLLYHTGMRAGELAALRVSDIMLGVRSGNIQIRRGKGNKARLIPLNAEARAVLRSYVQIRPACEKQTLLVGQRGEPLSSHAIYHAIYDVVVKYGQRAGLEEVTPHTLRHTIARRLLAAGVPLSNVADLLGHSSLDTTRIYTKASGVDLAAAVARLEMT